MFLWSCISKLYDVFQLEQYVEAREAKRKGSNKMVVA